jgi:hypothetical protein
VEKITQWSGSTTIAIVGAVTMVGNALFILLEGAGYEVKRLEASYPTGLVDELLDGVDALLLAPDLSDDAREAFLGAIRRIAPKRQTVAVLTLLYAYDGTAVGELVVLDDQTACVPWTSNIEELARRIECAPKNVSHTS